MEKMENKSNSSSILSRFKRVMIIIYVICIVVSLPTTYFVTKNQVYATANNELGLLVDMVKAVRDVVREDTRPHFMKTGDLFPVVVSSTVMANTVASKFKRNRPNYHINIASDNPLNAKNKPQPLEQSIIDKFRADRSLKNTVGKGVINDTEFLVASSPSKAKEGCLTCHGNPDDTPKSITDTYGKTSGFNYKVGSVVGASFVGVPLGNINNLVIKRSIIVVILISIFFAFLLTFILMIVKKEIIKPLNRITKSAHEVSHGNTDASVADIAKERDDEIGSLANSFELMRRSLELVMRKLNK